MNPHIERMRAELGAIRAAGTGLCADLGDAQFNRRLERGRWSIAECLVHLNIRSMEPPPKFRMRTVPRRHLWPARQVRHAGNLSDDAPVG